MKKRISLMLALILVLAVVVTGCGNEPADDANEGGEAGQVTDNPAKSRDGADNTIILGMEEAKGEFMPVYYSTSYDGYAIGYIFDTLLSNDEEGNPIPHVAEEWEISEDKKTYTFHLRDDVKFSDGEPLTAEDVEFTYLVMADPEYDGRYFSKPERLEGYEEYHEGDADNISGLEVIDDHTIAFTFKEAESTNIWECNMGIMPKHYYDFEKGDIDALKAKMQEPLGSGPYILENYEPKQFIEYTANEDYFLGAPKIENLILKFIKSETEIQEAEKGTVDIVLQAVTTPENKEIIDGLDYLHINDYPNNGYCFLGWNLEDPRFQDKKVRQALAYGFNRQEFVDVFFKGHGQVCHTPISQVSWAFTDELREKLNEYEYNPEKAKQLLDEAGWKEGADGIREKDGQKLDFTFSTFQDVEWIDRLIPMLKADWEKIGVNVEPNLLEFNALSDLVFQDRDFDIFSLCWDLSIDPDSSDVFHSKEAAEGGNNAVAFKNDKNDELLEAGIKEFDPEKRKEIYEEWGLLMNEELPYLFVYIRDNWNIVNDRVKNFELSPFVDPTHPSVVIEMELEE